MLVKSRPSTAAGLGVSRKQLLKAIRGVKGGKKKDDTNVGGGGTCYKCFALEQHHIEPLISSSSSTGNGTTNTFAPEEFHRLLCERIRSAKQRVYLASLYIGPAVDAQKYPKELEFLNALRDIRPGVDTKILLDFNRALRPVPLPNSKTNTNNNNKNDCDETTITSAEACRRAVMISAKDEPQPPQSKVFLLSALHDIWQRILPNPLNEVQGVFHLKAYITDDNLILSGANLSEEYFMDRHDRYLSIQHGGNGLVQFYADLVTVLCQQAHAYTTTTTTTTTNQHSSFSSRRKKLLEAVAQVVMTKSDGDDDDNLYDSRGNLIHLDKEVEPQASSSDTPVVALAVPTFQAPPRFGQYPFLRYDVDAIQDLIRQASTGPSSSSSADGGVSLRMASAYLNPTQSFLNACQNLKELHMLTAGRISHGFKPKTNHRTAGNQGRDWIPTVFDELARKILRGDQSQGKENNNNKWFVWFYQRDNWTFHAKGLWLSQRLSPSPATKTPSGNSANYNDSSASWFARFEKEDDLLAVTHGSGNFGARSEFRDFESNLVLLFPPKSPLAEVHKREWNEMADYTAHSSLEPVKQLSWHLKLALPFIKTFF